MQKIIASAPAGETTTYFILARQVSLVKIGRASNVKRRLCELQSSSPCHLDLIGTICSPYSLEPVLHELLCNLRVRGEWFKYTILVKNLLFLLNKIGYKDLYRCINAGLLDNVRPSEKETEFSVIISSYGDDFRPYGTIREIN